MSQTIFAMHAAVICRCDGQHFFLAVRTINYTAEIVAFLHMNPQNNSASQTKMPGGSYLARTGSFFIALYGCFSIISMRMNVYTVYRQLGISQE